MKNAPFTIQNKDQKPFDNSKKLDRAPRNITREIEDDYAKVVFQQEKWRVIECKDSIQWIIQRCGNLSCAKPRWKPISYCTTRKALIRVWTAKTGEHSNVLDALPETFCGIAYD
jgi:hypothetical protein